MPVLTHTSTLANHSAAIQVAGDVSPLQRRAWDMLLYHAFSDLEEHETHTIGVGELTRMLGITTRNSAHLRETLEGLTSTIVRWNALGKDGKRDWGASSMLAFFRVREGTIEYGFGPIRKNLHNPSMYARVRLMATNRFTSKHAARALPTRPRLRRNAPDALDVTRPVPRPDGPRARTIRPLATPPPSVYRQSL